ncbi:MAG TPA: glycosyltransferase family 39 protein [Blastocatellia bacterium]|nr:glycosyltransferase family 39 protein [Blastocatellia bacterium]
MQRLPVEAGESKSRRRHYDLILFTVLLAGFVFITAQRLGTVPLPETDEAYTLQVPYEMIFRGKLALPMLRFLGGNVENVWHSYTPVFFVILTGFFKLVGYGLTQGRAFNLITAALTLGMTYLVGRRFFNWRVGMIAALLLVSDLTFLERSRMLRNDFAAAFFALLAFYLFEAAEQRRRGWLYVASGVAAGAGVMSHTNILYMLGAICLLMLLRYGLRIFTSAKLYQFLGGALAVMSYEIIYDILDWQNFLLQNRADSLHFSLIEGGGWWRNIVGEIGRYQLWYEGTANHYGVFYGQIIPDIPRTLIHVFQALTVVAVVYLIVVFASLTWRHTAMSDLRVHLLVVTVFTVLFHAVITGHKEIYYLVHLVPWFALCAGVAISDGLASVFRVRWAILRRAVFAVGLVAAVGFGYLLVSQSVAYYKSLRNPDFVSFDEYVSALREIVPEGVCPVTKRSPAIWLAFPEMDLCFASIESRMKDDVDIKGQEYVLIVPEKASKRVKERKHFHYLGELKDTAYKLALRAYYTGNDPRYLAREPKNFTFFGWSRGHVTEEQVSAAHEVWSAGPSEMGALRSGDESVNSPEAITIYPTAAGGRGQIELASVEVKPDTIYDVNVAVASTLGAWEVAVIDARTGARIVRMKVAEDAGLQHIAELFRTPGVDRVRIVAKSRAQNSREPLSISRISIREVAPLR